MIIDKHFYRLYKCLHCDHASSIADNLDRHMKRAHDYSTITPSHVLIEEESSEDDCDVMCCNPDSQGP
uniref:C2H2-type domain-containing protein n=1 Tax=Tetranychus urticae TaxID=32264 RepID=T1KLV9_TETUR